MNFTGVKNATMTCVEKFSPAGQDQTRQSEEEQKADWFKRFGSLQKNYVKKISSNLFTFNPNDASLTLITIFFLKFSASIGV